MFPIEVLVVPKHSALEVNYSVTKGFNWGSLGGDNIIPFLAPRKQGRGTRVFHFHVGGRFRRFIVQRDVMFEVTGYHVNLTDLTDGRKLSVAGLHVN